MTARRSDENRKEWHLPKHRTGMQKGPQPATPISLYGFQEGGSKSQIASVAITFLY